MENSKPVSESQESKVSQAASNEKMEPSEFPTKMKFADTLLLAIYTIITIVSMSMCSAGFFHFFEAKLITSVRNGFFSIIFIVLCLAMIILAICYSFRNCTIHAYVPIQTTLIIISFLGLIMISGFLLTFVVSLGGTNNLAYTHTMKNFSKTMNSLNTNYTNTVKNLQTNYSKTKSDFNFSYSIMMRDFSSNYSNSQKLFNANYTSTMENFVKQYTSRKYRMRECMRGCQYLKNATSLLICCYMCVT